MSITSILDRVEDRIFETVKSWNSGGQSKDTLLFDLDLIKKSLLEHCEFCKNNCSSCYQWSSGTCL
jgi:hypothetical protein